jgi:perosamine synthetase
LLKAEFMGSKGWRFSGNELKYLEEVLRSGFTAGASGSMNERLEIAFAQQHHQKYAITANSGTSTLHMALYAFGVGPGDEVIIPALTVASCGYAVWHSGATPVYADVLPDTFLMDPADVERKITNKTKAIMPVHIYGLMCDMDAIMKIAHKYGLFVVEDCAQSFLAHDHHGRIAGTVGHVGSWSLENSKHISTGDGGIVTTNDEELALKMRQFGGVGFKNITAASGKVRVSRDKFQDPLWERHNIFAYNYRLPEICAAVGLAQTERMTEFVDLRVKMGEGYLSAIGNSNLLLPQKAPVGYKNTYYTFAAQFNGSENGIAWQEFRKKHMEFGGDGIYAAWQTVNNEPCFRDSKIGWGEVPVAEMLQRNMMQFTTNQASESEREIQMSALSKTISYFS